MGFPAMLEVVYYDKRLDMIVLIVLMLEDYFKKAIPDYENYIILDYHIFTDEE